MIALVQRVSRAEVRAEGSVVGQIGAGLMILLGVHVEDTESEVDWLARKCSQLRIFADEDGKMNRSVLDVAGQVLVVSQFTLYGNVERGNRPSFVDSAPPDIAEPLYNLFLDRMTRIMGQPTAAGMFGAIMEVELVNDGPVTIIIETKR